MKTFLFALLMICILPAKCFGMHVQSVVAGIDLNTTKVVNIVGPIDGKQALEFTAQVAAGVASPGPYLVYINSPGGEVGAGSYMIAIMEGLQKEGVEFVCVVDKSASSMAFNLLSYCDKRLYTPRSYMVVHKIALNELVGERYTARKLRDIALMLDSEDEGFRQKNAPLMHLSLKDYDTYADQESCWTGDILFKRGYFNGVAKVTK